MPARCAALIDPAGFVALDVRGWPANTYDDVELDGANLGAALGEDVELDGADPGAALGDLGGALGEDADLGVALGELDNARTSS